MWATGTWAPRTHAQTPADRPQGKRRARSDHVTPSVLAGEKLLTAANLQHELETLQCPETKASETIVPEEVKGQVMAPGAFLQPRTPRATSERPMTSPQPPQPCVRVRRAGGHWKAGVGGALLLSAGGTLPVPWRHRSQSPLLKICSASQTPGLPQPPRLLMQFGW